MSGINEGEYTALFKDTVKIIDNGGFCTVEQIGDALVKHDLKPLFDKHLKVNIGTANCSDALYTLLEYQHSRFGTETTSGGTQNGYLRLLMYLFELLKG